MPEEPVKGRTMISEERLEKFRLNREKHIATMETFLAKHDGAHERREARYNKHRKKVDEKLAKAKEEPPPEEEEEEKEEPPPEEEEEPPPEEEEEKKEEPPPEGVE